MFVRFFAFFIWALLAAAAVFWLLRLTVSAPTAPDYTVVVGENVALQGDLTRLLGAATAPAVAAASAPPLSAEASRFKLVGVMAPPARQARTVRGHGWALIAVDGKLPRTYSVGGAIDGDLVLQNVSLRTADIGPSNGNPLVKLELPPLAQAATGALPSAPNGDGGLAQPPQQQFNPVAPPPPAAQGDAFVPPPPAAMLDPEGNPIPEAAMQQQAPAAAQPAIAPEARPRTRIPVPPRGNSTLQQQRY
jgi:general secretion pathway protein C